MMKFIFNILQEKFIQGDLIKPLNGSGGTVDYGESGLNFHVVGYEPGNGSGMRIWIGDLLVYNGGEWAEKLNKDENTNP